MATQNGSASKSEAIRGILTLNPKTKTNDVIDQLGQKGVKVAPTLVYYVRSQLSKSQRKDKRARIAETSSKTSARNPVELVQQVKTLAREVGGMANLKKLVDLLAE